VCALESRVSSRDAQPSTYRNVNWALFYATAKSTLPFETRGHCQAQPRQSFFHEEKRIGACLERSAEFPLKLCRGTRILEKPDRHEGGEI